ncbi:SAM-dependent methyltransferase [Saccharomonospora xinjiangensis]|uniref:SAM-dependent methyltransferase n=1 Tax=Saccharomonospora xinjiangensis TaxID=75294 RepID=UPI00106F55C7|nr:SAM-dependent methyltransferase [Saccharomonospora xinjiangensis]QBQ59280.1 S-adenosyl methyltransferase [Saccharomonospora xinjiangensis]
MPKGASQEAPDHPEPPGGAVAPNIARIRNFWLGGNHYSESDRALAERIELCGPHIPYLVRAQRALVRRQVRYLAEQGVDQFLDLGSGLPDLGYVHHVAQELNPACRVGYVDLDATLAADAEELLAGTSGARFVVADCRDIGAVLDHPVVREVLDPARPFAVLMTELLLHVPDSERPEELVAAWVEAMPSGSHLVISHFGEDEDVLAGFRIFERLKFGRFPEVSLRPRQRVAEFFAGLDLVEPGVVPAPLWRPGPDDETVLNPEDVRMFAGVGRKR